MLLESNVKFGMPILIIEKALLNIGKDLMIQETRVSLNFDRNYNRPKIQIFFNFLVVLQNLDYNPNLWDRKIIRKIFN